MNCTVEKAHDGKGPPRRKRRRQCDAGDARQRYQDRSRNGDAPECDGDGGSSSTDLAEEERAAPQQRQCDEQQPVGADMVSKAEIGGIRHPEHVRFAAAT